MPYGCLPTDIKRNKRTKKKKKEEEEEAVEEEEEEEEGTEEEEKRLNPQQPALQHGDVHEKWFLKETKLSLCFSASHCW